MSQESSRFARLLEDARLIDNFKFCGPSDDPDEQTAVVYGFKTIATRLVKLSERIKNKAVQDAIAGINLDIDDIYGVYDLNAELQLLIEELRYLSEHPADCQWGIPGGLLIESRIINELRTINSDYYDLGKIARLCEELNECYERELYLACSLLIRTLLNHVPPIFGCTSFAQVVANSQKSLKEILRPLEDIARDIADYHAHAPIRHKECLPSMQQIEPFKPSLEFLLHEVIVRISPK